MENKQLIDESRAFRLQGTLENKSLKVDKSAGSGGIYLTRLNHGITITIMDCKLHEPVSIQFEPPFESLGFGFSLEGNMEVRPKGRKQIFRYKPGQTDLNANPVESKIEETLGAGRMLRVCLTMDHEVLERLTPCGDKIPGIIAKRTSGPSHLRGRITPAMKTVIAQILQCPFQGWARNLFLEGKALELLAHKLANLDNPVFNAADSVKPADMEKVLYAAELITSNFDSPLCLEDLSRSAGMCRTRFHECFCKVHGKTPFEYLQEFRLEKAMNLLVEGRMNVTEAAFEVGYSSSGYFSKVFKKQYGYSPGKFAVRACVK